jgi:hypothetical protein
VSRRAQIGLASLALTLVWMTALFAVFVGFKVGQHPSTPVILALGGALCAVLSGVLLTLACFPGFGECLRAVAQVGPALAPAWKPPRWCGAACR